MRRGLYHAGKAPVVVLSGGNSPLFTEEIRHYALLSGDALLEIDRAELVDAARPYYDAELAGSKLALPETEESAPADQGGDPALGAAEDGPQLIGTFLSLEDANLARGLLQSADIPCALENEYMAQRRGSDCAGGGGRFQRRRIVVNISPLRPS